MSTICRTVINALDALAPVRLAEKWDNVGLLVGSPNQSVNRIVVSLDVNHSVIDFAEKTGANLIVAHHPVIFKPITAIRQDTPQGELLYRLIQQDISVIAAHTNLDAARGGVNDALAHAIELKDTAPLTSIQGEQLYKLAVFVPEDYLEQIRSAIGSAGAGHIGQYSNCSFSAKGEGTFLPLMSAKPFIGTNGELEKVSEYKLETIVPESLCRKVIARMLSAHPYEEVAYDLYKLENTATLEGQGRIGRLPLPVCLRQFAEIVKAKLKANIIKTVGNPESVIQTVALCGGSGAEFISMAKQAGADVYLTGDIKYHDAQQALSLGLSLVDAGHFSTEVLVIKRLVEYLSTCSQGQQWGIQVYAAPEADVFW